jgi:hypothetical protein
MSKSVAPLGAGDRLSLTDEEIAEIVGVALETLPKPVEKTEKIAKIEEVAAPDVATPEGDAFLGRRWGLQDRLH